jgi:hypothetical protein
VFVSSPAATRFREALATQRLDAVLAAAADPPRVGLNDALEILALLAESSPAPSNASTSHSGEL